MQLQQLLGCRRRHTPVGPSPLLTCVVDDIVIVWVCDNEGHQVGAGKVVLGDGEESGALLRVVVAEEALQVAQAAYRGRRMKGGEKREKGR